MHLLPWVALGGAIGASLRHLLAVATVVLFGEAFPWGTLVCNVLGSLAIGWLAPQLAQDAARAFLMIGVLGGFTTFSSFSLQTVELAQQGHHGLAALYVTASVVGCIAATAVGFALAVHR
jgi:CrcB protein